VKIDVEKQTFRAVKGGTSTKNGSYGDTVVGSIVLDAMAENNKHSYTQLRWFGQSQSSFTDWRVVNEGENR